MEQQPISAPVAPQPKATYGGLAIAALIVGIIAFLSGWIPVFGMIVGVVALVLGIVALNKKQHKVMSVFGIVLGSLALISSLLATLFWGAVFNAARDSTHTNTNTTSNYTTPEDSQAALAKKFAVSKLTYATDGTQKVLAEIKNNDSASHSVTLRITFYDASGNILGTASGTTYSIGPGQSKTFDSATVNDVSGYKDVAYDFVSIF